MTTARFRVVAAAGAAILLLAGAALALARLVPGGGQFSPLGIEFRQTDQLRGDSDSAQAAPDALSVGQVFRSEHANLSSIAVQLTSYNFHPPASGRFHLQAGDDPNAPDVVTLPLTAANFRENPYLTFHFAPLADSAGHTYRFRIDTAESLGPVMSIELTSYDSYSAGYAVVDGAQQPGDLAFRTFYTYTPANLLADVANGLAGHAWLALAALAFLVLPGNLLARLVGSAWRPDERLLAAPALTLLAWPVLLLAGWVLGITGWGPWLVWAVILVGAAGLVALWLRRRNAGNGLLTTKYSFAWTIGDQSAVANPQSDPVQTVEPIQVNAPDSAIRNPGRPLGPAMDPPGRLYWVALAAILALTLISRLATIRDLVAGMGLDAYHHTLITALFLDRGGVPHDYAPYAPLASFTYHYGFHALAAALGWLAPGALPVQQLMVLAGQLVTTLPVITLALFGTRVLGNRWLGLVAGALVGLVAVFPAFYVNWSRYTQGLGLALLPVAWVVLFDALAPVVAWRAGRAPLRTIRTGPWRTWAGPALLAAVSAAGLFLSHYRIAALFASYAALFLAVVLVRTVRQAGRVAWPRQMGALLEAGLLVTVGALVLLLPWLINLRSNFTVRFAGSADQSNAAYYDLRSMLGDVPIEYWSTALLLGLAGLGLLGCLVRRDWPPVLLAVWFGLHLLWSNPTLVHLPGSGYVDTVTVVTSGFIPVCLLAAYPLVWLGGLLVRGWPHPAWAPAARAMLAVGGFLLLALASLRLLPILDVRPYVTPQDLAGMAWLRANTPPGALVLGQGFGWPWGPEAVQGSDAGVWIPVLADRRSPIPPPPAYNERLADPNYLYQAAQLVRASAALQNPASWATLRRQGVGYLYLGARGGTAMDPATILQMPAEARLVFHQDDVWIFALTGAQP